MAMGEVESGSGAFVRKEITHEEFAQKVNTYKPDQQEAVATLSSVLLEPDLRQKIVGNPQEIKSLVSHLKDTGLQIRDILFVMRYFGLPNPNPYMASNPTK